MSVGGRDAATCTSHWEFDVLLVRISGQMHAVHVHAARHSFITIETDREKDLFATYLCIVLLCGSTAHSSRPSERDLPVLLVQLLETVAENLAMLECVTHRLGASERGVRGTLAR